MKASTSALAANGALALLAALILAACSRGEGATPAAQAAPAVTVAAVVSRPITDSVEFVGHFEAVERVEIRPRVSGYVASINFAQGHEVHKGEVLVVVDPRPYVAALKQAQAQLAQARTQHELALSEKARAEALQSAHAISREELESRVAAAEQGAANVEAGEAAVDEAQLNLSYTQITAPITGIVSRAEVTAGNLVTGGQTLLTTVVSADPIYVSFEGDERGYLEFIKNAKAATRPVFVGLMDEQGYPHQGSIVFVDNEIDASTGTIRARGLLENHQHQFTPGMYARVRVPGEQAHEALLVNDSAISTDQSVKYVLRIGSNNTVEYAAVTLGAMVDGLRVVESGLQPGDTIIVSGLQRVRPGMQVTPQRVAMGNGPDSAGARVARSAP